MTETKPSKGIRTRLREWFRTAGLTGGAYFFSGAACPCCGSTCPVGFSGAALVGTAVAFLQRVWRTLRTSVSAKLQQWRSSAAST